MKYLGLALYSEGRTDDYFLRPLLLRLCADICLQEGQEPVDFGDVEALSHPPRLSDAPRHERILAAASGHRDAWQILFIHGDGEGDPDAAWRDRVQPGIEAVQTHFAAAGRAVGVVPVRETESWGLHDGQALRSVFGTTLSDARLQLPGSARAVEAAKDPKAILNRAFLQTGPNGQRQRKGVSPYLNALGEQVDLARLRELPSFSQLVDNLRAALRSMHVIA
ncbi:DUF4276 family protein [Leptothrix discophora]|uniref:DUF4276 family protein n=1 Tax=Leptothrix discophora TaxID=89 RepID=A0ABT9G954_LEPDI|nr:DUF4276 family protein [Leptothrix discophora]MDP4302986.1 DUF4276 family protein [Leptothrix discophora]